MNFISAIELNKTISVLNCNKASNIQIFDAQKDGYLILINKKKVDDRFLNYLKRIVKEKDLKLKTSDKYYIISSTYAWINL